MDATAGGHAGQATRNVVAMLPDQRSQSSSHVQPEEREISSISSSRCDGSGAHRTSGLRLRATKPSFNEERCRGTAHVPGISEDVGRSGPQDGGWRWSLLGHESEAEDGEPSAGWSAKTRAG